MKWVYEKNIFLEAKRMTEMYLKENTDTTVARKTSPISNNKQQDYYNALVKKLMQLGSSN